MKISREALIGLVAIITIAASIWGYKYLKGENIFRNDNIFIAEYNFIDQLSKSDPVLINGFQVGSVLDIQLNEENNNTLLVTFSVVKEIKVPPGSMANIVTISLMGSKGVDLKLNGVCREGDCLESGSKLEGTSSGLVESMLGLDEVDAYMNSLNSGLKQFIDTLDKSLKDSEDRDGIGKSVKDIELSIEHLKLTAIGINKLIQNLNTTLPSIFDNINGIAQNLNKEGETIDLMLRNIAAITQDLKDADIQGIASNADKVIKNSSEVIESLEETATQLNALITAINNGEGSLGKLVADESLYDNLNKSTRNLELLLQDLRLNPKRYIHVSVFGKSGKDYEVPEDDPAYQD